MRLTALPAFEDNYIWALARDDGRAVIVDPGDAAPVLAAEAQGLRPEAVLVTHHHADHCGGVPELQARWPGLPVYAPADDRLTFAHTAVGDGGPVQAAGFGFEVLSVPGHTLSHVAFHGAGIVFCGDTLFSLGCGRLFEGTPAQMLASLERLAALPADTRVCCGHEYSLANAAFAAVADPDNAALRARTEEIRHMRQLGRPSLPVRLASELDCNPFLRTATPAVIASVAARLGHAPASNVDTFAELRRWKDGFRA